MFQFAIISHLISKKNVPLTLTRHVYIDKYEDGIMCFELNVWGSFC